MLGFLGGLLGLPISAALAVVASLGGRVDHDECGCVRDEMQMRRAVAHFPQRVVVVVAVAGPARQWRREWQSGGV